jgi:hypothetical protein
MIAPIDKARGEGNCGRATDRGEEAGTSAARLRTETSYKAGGAGRACAATDHVLIRGDLHRRPAGRRRSEE